MTINNLKQFLDITNVSRCTNKKVIDNYILFYNIVNDDLIADIYQVCGI
jgi:hypothetical protein